MAERKRKLDVDDSPSAKKQELLPEDDPTGGVNPYTGKGYSSRYYEILKKRKGVVCCRTLLCRVLYGCQLSNNHPADSMEQALCTSDAAVAAAVCAVAAAVAAAAPEHSSLPWLSAI
jgi:hypothetical protein